MPSNYLNLKKIQETEVQKEYFPFFTVSNSFLEDVNSSALVEDFPDISEGGSFPVDLNAGQNIKDLIKELESQVTLFKKIALNEHEDFFMKFNKA